MDSSVQIAFIVAVFGFVGPVAMAAVTYLVHRAEKKEDYARQDAEAAKAAEVAHKASAKVDTVASSLLASNERAEEMAEAAAIVTNNKLDKIHVLVNSQTTALIEAELLATQRGLTLMREVVSLKIAAGHVVSPEALNEISATESKVAELQAKLMDRQQVSQPA